MPKIRYQDLTFQPQTMELIYHANYIIAAYTADGYNLTLRQLYYQFVARDLLANNVKNYNRLGDIVSRARRAGLIDWEAIVDRTRMLRFLPVWEGPEAILDAVASQYREDLWESQSTYAEVWFEKDALLGVFERATEDFRVPHFSCRGYPSDSEVWAAAQRFRRMTRRGKKVVLFHFGDHDPSGMDMTRDLDDRLYLFGAHDVQVQRVALTMDQVEQYDPPPNPAKESDSRFQKYMELYGDESWELDALDPPTLVALVTEHVEAVLDMDQWEEDLNNEGLTKGDLTALAKNWDEAVGFIRGTEE